MCSLRTGKLSTCASRYNVRTARVSAGCRATLRVRSRCSPVCHTGVRVQLYHAGLRFGVGGSRVVPNRCWAQPKNVWMSCGAEAKNRYARPHDLIAAAVAFGSSCSQSFAPPAVGG